MRSAPHDRMAAYGGTNRRNYYRLLHVQPEAPTEVIKASYRTLMTRLGAHPDRGGSHEWAVLVNEAYAVLSDPEQRQRYDAELRQTQPPGRLRAKGYEDDHSVGSPRVSRVTTGPTRTAGTARTARTPAELCPLCEMALHRDTLSPHRCPRCRTPLTALAAAPDGRPEFFGRRRSPRREQGHAALIHIGWPARSTPIRWKDVSASGMCFYAHHPIEAGLRFRLEDTSLEACGEVLHWRSEGRVYTVHARLITALPLRRSGVFVSTQA